MKRILLFVWLLNLSGIPNEAADPFAQAKGSGQTIRISSHLVLVPVSVTDDRGEIVSDLGIEDFSIEENGEAATISRIGDPGEMPLEIALLFDVSGSVHSRLELERAAAASFLREILRAQDQVSIIGVGTEPQVYQTRTSSLAVALHGLEMVAAAGEATALYDAVATAAERLRAEAPAGTRRTLLVLSDGEDNRSRKSTLSDAIQEVQKSDCIFYSINPSGRSIRINRVSLRGQEAMESLAAETGGAAFVIDDMEALEEIYSRIATELQTHYILAYYSPNPESDSDYRRIKVRVPSRPDLRIRARQGYYTTPPSPKEPH